MLAPYRKATGNSRAWGLTFGAEIAAYDRLGLSDELLPAQDFPPASVMGNGHWRNRKPQDAVAPKAPDDSSWCQCVFCLFAVCGNQRSELGGSVHTLALIDAARPWSSMTMYLDMLVWSDGRRGTVSDEAAQGRTFQRLCRMHSAQQSC